MNKLIRLQHQRILNDSLLEKDYFLQRSLSGLSILSLKDARVTLGLFPSMFITAHQYDFSPL